MATNNKHTILIVAAVLVLTLGSGTTTTTAQAPEPSMAMGPSSAEAPTPDCMTNLLNLSDCLTYVQAGSNLTKPDKACCPELAGLVESSPQCLCYLLDKNKTSSYGIDIDMKRALNLPTVCHVATPSVSLCSVINGGATAPSPSGGGLMPSGSAQQGSAGPAASLSNGNGNSNGASNFSVFGVGSLVGLAIAFLPTLLGI